MSEEQPNADLLALKRELNAVYLRRARDLPYTDEAVLQLLSVIERIIAHSPMPGEWEKVMASSGIVSLGNWCHAPATGALSPARERALGALIDYAASPHAYIAGGAAHSLGMLKRREGIPALQRMIQREPYADEPQDRSQSITVPAVAFRALAKIDRDAAREFIGTPACRDYLRGVEIWLQARRARTAAEELIRELVEESAWLRE